MTSKLPLARALYDNYAETPDEVAFRRGDVLTVLEQDTAGLDGWWLCSFRGKQGIAPGNRLKLLKGTRETGDLTLDNRYEAGKKGNALQRMAQSKSPVILEDYDVPPSRNVNLNNSSYNQSFDEQSTYDTPPSSRNETVLNTSSSFDQSIYDTPPTNKSYGMPPDSMYDVPPTAIGSPSGGEMYDIPAPSSNRSSIISNLSHLSNESTMTYSSSNFSNKSHGQNSNAASMCDSARSSMDISPQDFYDVPPSHRESRHTSLHHNKQPSADSGLDLYDSPPKVKTMPELPDQQDYDVPRSDYDTPKSISVTDTERTLERQKRLSLGETPKSFDMSSPKEHDIDDVYDVPVSNAPVRRKTALLPTGEMYKGDKVMSEGGSSLLSDINARVDPMGVYDIPPQVTRDSMLSSKSDSSDGTDDKRLSTCSVDSRNSDIPIYDELPLDLDAAMDLMVKLQQDVQRSTTKLSSFVSSIWRTRKILEPNIYAIKLASNGVRSSLEEFLDFAQGTLANSARLPDRKLINKLHRHLHPLQQTLVDVKRCLKNLEDSSWQLGALVTDDSAQNDDLGKIAAVSKDLTVDVRKLVSLIHGNSSLLFKRASDIPGYLLEPNSTTPVESCSAESKPPLQPKPLLPPKPGVAGRPTDLQHRPLPPPPPKERPLPPTPSDKKNILDNEKRMSGEFNRNSDDFRRYSTEFNQLSLELKAQDKQEKEKDLVEEYDYVHLEARDVDEQLKRKISSEIRGDVNELPVRDPSLPAKGNSSSINHILPDTRDVDKITSDINGLNAPVSIRYESAKITQVVTPTIKLDPNDKQVLFFYSGQLETHSTLLTNAVDAFFACIEKCRGPKVFISHSKFVVVSAHKLVYIGDSLHKNLINNEIKNKIMHCANHLCNCLKAAVTTTKTAALQYPSVPAVQDMVDRVTDVSHAVYELKHVISQAAVL